MAEVLDPSEVEALLAAVDEAESDLELGGREKQIFTRRPEGLPEGVEIRDYDFKRPERVSKDQMIAIESLHESFARTFGAALSGFLRTIVEVKVASIEQLTFHEFTHSLPNPTCFNLLSAEPLEGSMCLEISPLIIYPIVDRLLGGSNADLFIPQRPLTAIEQRLVNKVLTLATAALSDAWTSVAAIQFEQTDTESNPALVQIVAPNEVVIVIGYELKMGGRAGTMSLCVPYNVIEPVVDRLSNQTWSAYRRQDRNEKARRSLTGNLESAKVQATAVLANTTMTLDELQNLEVGDLILTDQLASSLLDLRVEGRTKFLGKLGQFKGSRAYVVNQRLD